MALSGIFLVSFLSTLLVMAVNFLWLSNCHRLPRYAATLLRRFNPVFVVRPGGRRNSGREEKLIFCQTGDQLLVDGAAACLPIINSTEFQLVLASANFSFDESSLLLALLTRSLDCLCWAWLSCLAFASSCLSHGIHPVVISASCWSYLVNLYDW